MNAPATAAKVKREVTYTTVKMDDGRTVDFPGKRRLMKESTIVDGQVTVRLDFLNGEVRTFAIPEALMLRFAAHGAEQKLGDEVSGLEDVEDAVLAVDELAERLQAGDWGVRRESSGLAGTSILARALVEVMNKSAAEVKAFLKTKSQAEKNALRDNPRVAPVVKRLEADKVKKGPAIDTDALLAGFGEVAVQPELGTAAE